MFNFAAYFALLMIECLLMVFLVWCYLNEKKLIEWENRVIMRILSRIKKKEGEIK